MMFGKSSQHNRVRAEYEELQRQLEKADRRDAAARAADALALKERQRQDALALKERQRQEEAERQIRARAAELAPVLEKEKSLRERLAASLEELRLQREQLLDEFQKELISLNQERLAVGLADLRERVVCPNCGGGGQVNHRRVTYHNDILDVSDPCPDCGGSGELLGQLNVREWVALSADAGCYFRPGHPAGT